MWRIYSLGRDALSLVDLIPGWIVSNWGKAEWFKSSETNDTLGDGRREFLSRRTCSLHVLSGIISSVTAISAGICITQLTGNLYVPKCSSYFLLLPSINRKECIFIGLRILLR